MMSRNGRSRRFLGDRLWNVKINWNMTFEVKFLQQNKYTKNLHNKDFYQIKLIIKIIIN